MDKKVSVAFRLNGGLGTYLMEENFIQYFFDAFQNELDITVYAGDSGEQNEGIFRGQYFISKYFPRSMFRPEDYDLAVDINWFPNVLRINEKKIKTCSEKLQDVLAAWIRFRNDNRTKRFMQLDSTFDPSIYTYAIAREETRLTVCDIEDKLGVERSYRLKINCFLPEDEILESYGLKKGAYITLQQGVNIRCRTSASPRQWPNEHYKELCRILKETCPQIQIVQLGELANNRPIEGVDRCLLGQTNFESLKVILKNAKLHIDGDCGMVHLRKAMHSGPSIVLYGQTSEKVLGYDDDINLTSNVCKHWCGKLFDAWKRRCYIADRPLCMEAIKPRYVADIIKKYIEGCYQFPEKEKKLVEKLLSDNSISLDQEWVDNWLRHRTIYAYWLEKIKIQDLICNKLTPNGYIRVPVTEMPAYQYFMGDRKSYSDYMKLNDIYNPGHEHSVKRFEQLIESFQTGMIEEYYIAVDGTNRILDGAHRACWLASQYDLDSEITVLKLYGDWKM